MKKLIFSGLFVLNTIALLAQTPQNVSPGKGKGESIWESTTTILFIVGFILLMIVSRTWSKKIHQKRDELAKKSKEDTENNESDDVGNS